MEAVAERLHRLYQGNQEVHGTYVLAEAESNGTKQTGSAKYVYESVSVGDFQDHLDGKTGLAIVPIRGDGKCFFGALDIDEYPIDHQAVAQKLADLNAPGIVTRSKSGGAHIWFFFKDPITARALREKLRAIAAAMGKGQAEIFPKQTQVIEDRGDVGNFINVPYQDTERTMRYAINDKGERLTVHQFCDLAEKMRSTPQKFGKLKFITDKDRRYEDAPPCLQHLAHEGFPEGSRNIGLTNFGIYCKKKWPDDWQDHLRAINSEHMDPPIPAKELATIEKSLSRKDFNYMCKQEPLCGRCNSAVCRVRKFGVGEASIVPITSLQRLTTDPPLWFVDVEDTGRLVLTTEQLHSQTLFSQQCVGQLCFVPPSLKPGEYREVLSVALESVVDINPPPEATVKGELTEVLLSFLNEKPKGDGPDELTREVPYYDEEGVVYFRLQDLVKYINNRRVLVGVPRNKLIQTLREVGCEGVALDVQGRKLQVWKTKAPARVELHPIQEEEVPF